MHFHITRYKTTDGLVLKGNTVQCLRYETTEKNNRGHRRQVNIISLDRWAEELTTEAKGLLTEKEQAQWRRWKTKHDQEYIKEQARSTLNSLPSLINASIPPLSAGVMDYELSEKIWTAISKLSLALEHYGFPDPEYRPDPADYQEMGTQHWPNGEDPPLPNFLPPGTPGHRKYELLLERYRAQLRTRAANATKKTKRKP